MSRSHTRCTIGRSTIRHPLMEKSGSQQVKLTTEKRVKHPRRPIISRQQNGLLVEAMATGQGNTPKNLSTTWSRPSKSERDADRRAGDAARAVT